MDLHVTVNNCCFFLFSFQAQKTGDVKRSVVSVYVAVYKPGTTFIQFDPTSYTKSMPENSASNALVFTVSAKGPSGTISYSIVGGNTNSAFKIARQSGQVRVAGSLDRETQATYKLVIRAEQGILAKEVTTTINIGDINDNSPRITFLDEVQPKQIAIEDFSPKGSYVIKVMYILET